MSASSEGSRPPMGIPGGVIALLLILDGMIGAFAACTSLPGVGPPPSSVATQAVATPRAQSNTTATAQVVNATSTAVAQMTATAVARTATAIATGPPIGFSVTTLHSGQTIQANIPLTIKGTYSSKGSGLVWVVLEDSYRNYYLQNPPVQFNGDGTWTATNINPGPGITMVDFVSVTSAGHKVFLGMLAGGFGAFHMLPADANNFLQIPVVVS